MLKSGYLGLVILCVCHWNTQPALQYIEMNNDGESQDWMACTLCRSSRQGVDVLLRAQQRKVDWPQTSNQAESPLQESLPYTTIDEAFESMLQYMSTSSRQCKRFFASSPPHTHNCDDKYHCSRFHTSQYPYRPRRHPLQQTENMNILVAPGTYAVTAGAWGKDSQQTHVVRLDPGQSVNLDFNL